MEGMYMTTKELRRLDIIQKVNEKRLNQAQAAEILNLSVIQIKRLYKNYRLGGPKV